MNQRISIELLQRPELQQVKPGIAVNTVLRCVESCNDSGDAVFRDEDTGDFYEMPACKITYKGDGK